MLNVDPKKLRGLGIQVAKLEKQNESSKGQNKSILNFLTKSPLKRQKTRNQTGANSTGNQSFNQPDSRSTRNQPGSSSTRNQSSNQPGFISSGNQWSNQPGSSSTGNHPSNQPGSSFAANQSQTGSSSTGNQSHENCVQPLDDIDEDILKELPEEIRREIEAERERTRNLNKKRSNLSKSEPNSHSVDQNLSSDEQNLSKHLQDSSKNEQDLSKNEASLENCRQQDLSFSQFDSSVLAQLPENIVQELKQEYDNARITRQNRQNEAAKKPKKSAFETIMSRKSPENQEKSRIKRGRPGKNSPRFIKKSNKVVPKKSIPKRNLNFDDKSVEDKFGNLNVSEEVPKLRTPSPEPEITLNGKSNLKDIKTMLTEWVKAVDEPTDDDTEVVIDFFVKKVRRKDIDFVYDTLKTFCRLCHDANQNSWTEMYNKVINQVQETFKSMHNGKRLFISFRL